jgi:hypothetical protein
VTRGDQSIVVSYRDPQGEVDLSTLRVLVNGADRTGQFQATPTATWRPQPGEQGLTEGQNVIVASIRTWPDTWLLPLRLSWLTPRLARRGEGLPLPWNRVLSPSASPPRRAPLNTRSVGLRDLTQFG